MVGGYGLGGGGVGVAGWCGCDGVGWVMLGCRGWWVV